MVPEEGENEKEKAEAKDKANGIKHVEVAKEVHELKVEPEGEKDENQQVEVEEEVPEGLEDEAEDDHGGTDVEELEKNGSNPTAMEAEHGKGAGVKITQEEEEIAVYEQGSAVEPNEAVIEEKDEADEYYYEYYGDYYYDDYYMDWYNEDTPDIGPRLGTVPVVGEDPLEDVPVNDDPIAQTPAAVAEEPLEVAPPGVGAEDETGIPDYDAFIPPTVNDAVALLEAPWFSLLTPGFDTVAVNTSPEEFSFVDAGDRIVFNRVPLYAPVENIAFLGEFSGVCTYQGSNVQNQFCAFTFDFGEIGTFSVRGPLQKLLLVGTTGVFSDLLTLSIYGEAFGGVVDSPESGTLPVGIDFFVNLDDIVLAPTGR